MKKKSALLYLSTFSFLFAIQSCKKKAAPVPEAIDATVSSNGSIYDPSANEVVGNFEVHQNQQWHGIICNDTAQFVRGTSSQIPVREGLYAAGFIVRPGDSATDGSSGERCEANHYNDTWHGYTQEAPGSEYYYGWSTYIPTSWVTPSVWAIFGQWHQLTLTLPVVSLNISGNNIQCNIYSGTVSGNGNETSEFSYVSAGNNILTSLSKGSWHDFIIRVKWTPDTTGAIEIWHRLQGQTTFTKIFTKLNIPTLQTFTTATRYLIQGPSAEIQTSPNTWTTNAWTRIGLYRNPEPTLVNVLFHDNWARATTYNAIANNFITLP